MLTVSEIIKNGKFIAEGKDRKVYKYNNSVYKLGYHKNYCNIREYKLSSNNESKYYNPVIKLIEEEDILEVEECISLEDLIKSLKGNDENFSIKMELINSYIYEVIEKYKLEKYMTFNKSELFEFCRNSRHDWDEITYPLNWGYNPKRRTILLIDYAD